MRNSILSLSLVGAAIIGGLVGGAAVASRQPERVFVPSFIYADLDQAQEASTHYYCTDIIGVPDGYRLEVLPNEDCTNTEGR